MHERSNNFRQIAYACLIAVSVLLLVPIAVLTWITIHGFEGGVTPNSQLAWRPLVLAQLFALLVYHSFGPGHFLIRTALFAFGFFCVETMEVMAFYMFSTFENSLAEYWASNISISISLLFIPMLAVGFGLHLFRFLIGTLRFEAAEREFQFSISNLLTLTFIVAAMAMWFTTFVDEDGLGRIRFYFFHKLTPRNIACVVGSVVLVFSKHWWLGGLVVFASLTWSTLTISIPDWSTLYWSFVLNGVFVLYRINGLRIYHDRMLLGNRMPDPKITDAG